MKFEIGLENSQLKFDFVLVIVWIIVFCADYFTFDFKTIGHFSALYILLFVYMLDEYKRHRKKYFEELNNVDN